MAVSMALRSQLAQSYTRDIFRAILEDILPSGSLNLRAVPLPIAATCEYVEGVTPIGRIELPDGNNISLVEVHVADQVRLAQNRVGLRNFVASFLRDGTLGGILAVFYQPGKNDWRLTYASIKPSFDEDTLGINNVQTAPRRFTFLLG